MSILYKKFLDINKDKLIFKTEQNGIDFFNNIDYHFYYINNQDRFKSVNSDKTLNSNIIIDKIHKKNYKTNNSGTYGIIHVLQYIHNIHVRKYIIQNYDINLKTKTGQTVMHQLCNSNFKKHDKVEFAYDIINEILDNSLTIDLNIKNYQQKSILNNVCNNKVIPYELIIKIINYNPKKSLFEKKNINQLNPIKIKKILTTQQIKLSNNISEEILSSCKNNKYLLLSSLLEYEKENNIKINYNIYNNYYLLYETCTKHIDYLSLVLKYRTNINDKINNYTILNKACELNNLSKVKEILKYKPNMNLKIRNKTVGENALISALNNKNLNMVKMLIEYDKRICNLNDDIYSYGLNDYGKKTIYSKKIYEYFKNLQLVNNIKPDYYKILYNICFTRTNYYVYNQRIEILKDALKNINNINYKYENGNTILFGDDFILNEIKEILKYNPDINFKNNQNNNILMYLIQKKYINDKIFLELLKHNPDLNLQNIYDETLLMLAIYNNRYFIVEELLKSTQNLDLKNNNNFTALDFALYNKDCDEKIILKIIDKTININSNLNSNSKSKNTYLMFAIKYNRINIINRLLEYNPDINIQNEYGETALIFAIKNNNLDIVKKILKCNPDVNIQDNNKFTALAIACYYNTTKIEIIKVLLKCKDININLTTVTNYPALKYAIKNKNINVVRLLVKNNALLSESLLSFAKITDKKIYSIIRKKYYNETVFTTIKNKFLKKKIEIN
tara:strand:- start:4293 stop:6491 length:2199 start_codon:yes stop_codon:yes gene_type:complete